MSDLTALIDTPRAIIGSYSPECLGAEISTVGLSPAGTSSAWVAANVALFVPLKLGSPFTVQKVFWANGSSVGSNHVDVGIYTPTGNLIVSCGSTLTTGTTQIQAPTVTATVLEPGLYYLGMVMDGTTNTIYQSSPTIPTELLAMGMYEVATAFPLPSTLTFTTLTTAHARLPLFGISSNTTL